MNESVTTARQGPDPPPRVALLAHGIGGHGGMERVHAELLRRLAGRYEFVVLAGDLDPDLRGLVTWYRMPLPRRPIPARIVAYAILAGIRLRGTPVDLVHACGAIVPNRVDVTSVHFCHAGYLDSHERFAPRDLRGIRRLNTTVKRAVAVGMEHWSYRPSRNRMLLAVSPQIEGELARHFPDADTAHPQRCRSGRIPSGRRHPTSNPERPTGGR